MNISKTEITKSATNIIRIESVLREKIEIMTIRSFTSASNCLRFFIFKLFASFSLILSPMFHLTIPLGHGVPYQLLSL